MSVVRIPPVLREVVGGSRELPATGGTVAEVLDGLFDGHPALADRLRQDGTLSDFVNVYINGDDIRHRQGLETPVAPDDVVILLPAMAGGSGLDALGGSAVDVEAAVRMLDDLAEVADLLEGRLRCGLEVHARSVDRD